MSEWGGWVTGGGVWINQLTQCWTFPSGRLLPRWKTKNFSLRSAYIPESVSLAHAKHARFHINVMLMCLWVMKETSQRGPVILGYERERQHEEFKAFPTKLISLWLGCSLQRRSERSLPRSVLPNWSCQVTLELVAWSEHAVCSLFSWGGCRVDVPPDPPFTLPWGAHVWRIRPTILEIVCGLPLTDFTWPDWAAAPLHMLQSTRRCPRGDRPLRFRVSDPHLPQQPPTFPPPHPTPNTAHSLTTSTSLHDGINRGHWRTLHFTLESDLRTSSKGLSAWREGINMRWNSMSHVSLLPLIRSHPVIRWSSGWSLRSLIPDARRVHHLDPVDTFVALNFPQVYALFFLQTILELNRIRSYN